MVRIVFVRSWRCTVAGKVVLLMATLKLDKNRGYLIAGIGAIVALFAFLYLPFVTLSETSPSPTGIVNSGSTYSISVTSTMAANSQGSIWLEGILALALLVLVCLLIYRTNPFGSSRTPIVNQIRQGIYGLGGGGILCILLQFFVSLGLAGAAGSEWFGNATSNVSVFYDYGSWLYLLGMLAVIVGSVIAYQKSGLVASAPGVSSYQAQIPSMPTPYPAPGSSPYDLPYPSSALQGSVPPYQQNVQPSSPYDVPGTFAPNYPQDGGMPYPYQAQYPQQGQMPPQQWPPTYPS